MTREEAIEKAVAFIEEVTAVQTHDIEKNLESRGATDEEIARIHARNERVVRNVIADAVRIIDEIFAREGQALH